MKGICINIDHDTLVNESYRKVLYTAPHSQLVLMRLAPGEEIGLETHADSDQFFRIESGMGSVVVDGNDYVVTAGCAAFVPAGAEHNVVNTSRTEPLQLYTIYSPPHHKDGLTRKTKQEADASQEEFDGKTTE